MKPLVYIAAPYSIGDKEANTRASMDVADRLLGCGLFIPLVPLLSHYWDRYSPKSYARWREIDKHLLSRCDALFRLPGESKGADMEVEWAREFNIPVFRDTISLMIWLKHDWVDWWDLKEDAGYEQED